MVECINITKGGLFFIHLLTGRKHRLLSTTEPNVQPSKTLETLEFWWQWQLRRQWRRHNPRRTRDSFTHHPNLVPRVSLSSCPMSDEDPGNGLGYYWQTIRGTYWVICVLLLCVGGVKMIDDGLEVLNHLLQLSVNVLCQLVTERLKKRLKINSKLMVKKWISKESDGFV